MIKDHGQSIRLKLLNISKAEKQEYMVLQEAIRNTFANRNTTYSENKHLFDEAFANDAKRNTYWRAFLLVEHPLKDSF